MSISYKLAKFQDEWFSKIISLFNKAGIKCFNSDTDHSLQLKSFPFPTGADNEWSKEGPNLWVNTVCPWIFRDDTWYCWFVGAYVVVDRFGRELYSYNKPVTFPYTGTTVRYVKQGSYDHLVVLARKALGLL